MSDQVNWIVQRMQADETSTGEHEGAKKYAARRLSAVVGNY